MLTAHTYLLLSEPHSAPLLIVDLGCGPGNSAVSLSAAFPGATIIGLDVDEAMVGYAQEHHTVHVDGEGNEVPTGCNFFTQDIAADWAEGWSEELKELLAGKVDAIFSNYTLHWVPSFDRLAANVSHLLRQNGRSVFAGNLLYCGDIAAMSETDEERALVEAVVRYPTEQQYIADFLFAFRNAFFGRFIVNYEETFSFYPEGFYKNSKQQHESFLLLSGYLTHLTCYQVL